MSRNPIEIIKNHYAQRALAREAPEVGVVRASQIGHDLRRLVMSYDPKKYRALPVTDRGMRGFERGDHAHFGLRRAMRDAWPKMPRGRFDEIEKELSAEDKEIEWQEELSPGWVFRGHPDCVVDDVEIDGRRIERAMIEIKSMNPFAFKRFATNTDYDYRARRPVQIGDEAAVGYTYWAQMQANLWGLRLERCVFIAERSDTRKLKQRVFPGLDDHVVPLLSKAKQVASLVDAGAEGLEIPACQGPDYGIDPSSKSMKLRWGCSYCPFWRTCFPEHVQFIGTRSLETVRQEFVPEGAKVMHVGHEVDPSAAWRMVNSEDDGEESED